MTAPLISASRTHASTSPVQATQVAVVRYDGIDDAQIEKLSQEIANELSHELRKQVEDKAMPQLRTPSENPVAFTAEQISSAIQAALQNDRVSDRSAGIDTLAASFDRNFGPVDQAVRSGQPGETRTPNGSAELIKSDPKFALLVALMLAMMELTKSDRETSVAMTKMSLDATKAAGDKEIRIAETRMGAAISAMAVQTAVGGAGLARSFKSSNTTIKSVKHNINPANQKQTAMASARHAAASKPTEGVPGEHTLTTKNGKSVTIPAHDKAETPAMQTVQRDDVRQPEIAQSQAAHTLASANAQKFLAQATLLNVMSQSVNGLVTSIGELSAAASKAEQMMLETTAATAKEIAGGQREQAVHNRQQRDAAFLVIESLHKLNADVMNHIVSKA
ncbi:IpaC/SipC family type III secretion system effector [Dyella sp. Tek66A03]|uniref:IpaC/SipC family type III secretion system effector n=1 Tax=Dyella sp. Tek66A03 TaxID=3458298 RepID=UPI00403E6332